MFDLTVVRVKIELQKYAIEVMCLDFSRSDVTTLIYILYVSPLRVDVPEFVVS